MDLFEHKVIILRWTNGCDTVEQLGLLTLFIGQYVYPKFVKEIEDKKGTIDKKVLKLELAETILELTDAIQDRKTILSGQNTLNDIT